MSDEERQIAFAMRLRGATFEEIAELLHYDPTTIYRDLHSVLEKVRREPAIIYPAVRAHIRTNYGGSIEAFARQLRVSPHRLRRFLVYGDMTTEHMLDKITGDMNMEREEAFAHALDLH